MKLNIYSDVLVLGTGGAGLRAAIEAHSKGVDVTVVSKAPAGMNNATVVAGGGFRAAVKGLTPEEHMEDTVRVGKNLNNSKLVRIFAKEGGKRVAELSEFGVEMKLREGGAQVGEIPTLMGLGLTRPLVEYLRDKGVRMIENLIVTKIIKEGDAVSGAVGYHLREEVPVIFNSKSVILATGGAGALYKRTDCPLVTTGDGYRLGYHAGATLRDMEFVQFFPLAVAEPGSPPFLLGGSITEKGRIINNLGEDIPEKYNITDRPLVLKSRDLLSRAVMLEILEGGGVDGAILVDAREVFKKMSEDEMASTGPISYLSDKLKAAEKPIRAAPICHFCMGGLDITPSGDTGVDGLYACGEVVGGIHGANRHGGNALTSIIVFGSRAGASAAEYVKGRDFQQVDSLATPEIDRYNEIISRRRGNSPHTIMSELRESMLINAGIIRDAVKLTEAFNKIQELRDRASRLSADAGRDMLFALQLPMALDASEMIIRSAMHRRESRGAHYRTDFLDQDPDWRRTVILRKLSNGAMSVSTRPLNNP
ncbi:MAG: FAD-binding protein [Candidatus Bathyarchaeia archaeon]